MIGHFNAGELASYRAGTVSDGKAARISAHLSTCIQCADIHSGLADVSRLLASYPAPPMPETLTQRLQGAIAAEAAHRVAASALRVAGPAATGDGSPLPIPGRPDLPKRGSRPARRPRTGVWASPLLVRGLAAAGALVLLVGGGILLANQRGVGTSSTVAGQGTARPAKSRPSTTAPIGSTAPIRLRYQHAGEYVFANAVTSDADYTTANLAAGVRTTVASVAQVAKPSVVVPGASAAAAPQRSLDHTTVGRLESCLSAVASGKPVMLVEIARYLGLPATIIVFEPVDRSFDVIVVGEACGPKGEDIITRLSVPMK